MFLLFSMFNYWQFYILLVEETGFIVNIKAP